MSKKISELTEATAVADADLFVIVQGGETKKVPASLVSADVAGTCTLEDFGAVGDGVTSDQAALVAALAALSAGTYETLLLGARTYLVTGNVTIPSGCAIIGQGWSASIFKTVTDQPVFKLDGSEDVVLRDFGIRGTDGASQSGIVLGGTSGQARVLIAFIDFLDVRHGIFAQTNNGGASGPQIIGCRARSCAYGYWTEAGSEFLTFVGCKAYQCNIGLRVGSGNISFVGGELNYNVTGVSLATGANAGHGIISGCNINHNSTAVTAGAIAYGFSLVGNHIYQGDITISGASGLVRFVGGQIDFDTLSVTTGRVRFSSVTFSADYFVGVSTASGGVIDVAVDCCSHDGTVPSWVASRRILLPPVAVGALDIDWALGDVFTKTLAVGSQTFTFSNQRAGQVVSIRLTTPGGGATITWPAMKWAGDAAPTLTAGKAIVITLIHDGTNVIGTASAEYTP